MAKPVDVLVELTFPVLGLDESSEYQEQRGGTAVDVSNCRGVEPTTLRLRGASRPGLSKLVADPVAEADFPVQDLNTMVVTGAASLLANYTVPAELIDVSYVLPPGTILGDPGWAFPIGGSGVQPNRNVPNVQSDDTQPQWFGGSVASGNGTGGYTLTIIGGGSATAAAAVNGVPQIPAGSGQLVLRTGPSTYKLQPPAWG